MKTVLFANRIAPELAPLTETSCVALLSVGCKPLIVHSVEALAMAELVDVMVVVSLGDDAVEAELGDGTRWGMRFEYVSATPEESEKSTVERIMDRLGDEYLLVRAEILRTPVIDEFVERSRSLGTRSSVATIGGVDAGIRWVKREDRLQDGVAGRQDDLRLPSQDESRIDFADARLSMLESLAAFHRASLDIVGGLFAGLVIPGREVAPGVRVGRHSRFSPKAIGEGPVLIGSRCKISDAAEIGGEVLISNDVVIDRHAVVRSSVIMPNTYVGELVEVTNAIVAGDRLIHVDTGTIATVVDSFLLASIGEGGFGLRRRALGDRVIGAALFCLSILLWPLALVAAILANPSKPIRSRLLIGNRNGGSKIDFRAFEFSTSIPLFRYLPYLLAVMAGHLRLVGSEPLDAVANAGGAGSPGRGKRKFGLLGPVQLSTTSLSEQQRRNVESTFAANRSFGQDLKWVLRSFAALVNGRAWRSPKPPIISKGPTVRTSSSSTVAKDSRRRIEPGSLAATTAASGFGESERSAMSGQ
jgi:mannose-1-phosphate guanylyltransferase / phosphomannomutase